jgi:hypothetical protein
MAAAQKGTARLAELAAKGHVEATRYGTTMIYKFNVREGTKHFTAAGIKAAKAMVSTAEGQMEGCHGR